jgi:hypothetical protein
MSIRSLESLYAIGIMPTRLAPWTMLLLLPVAFGQQLAFTSRSYVQSPVVIAAVERSKDFGFDAVVLRNDGSNPIAAVHFQITFRTDAGDEIAEERRVAVSLDARDSKRLVVGLAQIEGLKQQARSRRQESALAILTIESVEFEDGTEWKQAERDHGLPIDPLQPRLELAPEPRK